MNHQPDWWIKAQQLEHADRLDEAERVIEQAMMPNLPYAQQTAELYRLRTVRLLSEKRTSEAAEARQRAIRWIDLNASFATSGGEGAALSYVAEQFKRTLPEVPHA